MTSNKQKIKEVIRRIVEKKLSEMNSDFNGPGLIVTADSEQDNDIIDRMIEEEGFYGIYNDVENYWFFPEESGQQTDALEHQIEDALIKRGGSARYEAQYY